jgi:NAD(P)-dependent dehydrogenase (short-subunit alcohol dehydrogenase family)
MTALERGVAVVTGATGGMGQVIVLDLARRGMHVVTIARDPRRAEELQTTIAKSTGGSFEVIAGDLSHRDGITAAVATIGERHNTIHILVNNAGAHYSERALSRDGIEMHIAVDFLAGYGLTALLMPQLRQGRVRVVNVASDTLRDTRQVRLLGKPRPATLDVRRLDDLTCLNPTEGFVSFEAYARAKLLTVVAGYSLARANAGQVTVNAVHPGIVATNIIDSIIPIALRPLGGLIRRTLLTPEQGASAALRLATDPSLGEVSGRYFVRETPTSTPPVSYDHEIQRQISATTDRFLRVTSSSLT